MCECLALTRRIFVRMLGIDTAHIWAMCKLCDAWYLDIAGPMRLCRRYAMSGTDEAYMQAGS
eukprot:199531-Rhodomonas_salina.1